MEGTAATVPARPPPEGRGHRGYGGREAQTTSPPRRGKSHPIDAERAARPVLAGETAGVPRSGDGRVEMVRALRAPVARR